MNFRQKLGYTVLGAGLMFIGTIANNLTFSHETLKDVEFGWIKCSGITIGGDSSDSSSILLYAVNENATITMMSGKQLINIVCDYRNELPICEIDMRGGIDGDNQMELNVGEFDPILKKPIGIFVSNKGYGASPQASISVDRDGLGWFISRDNEDKLRWISPVK